MAKWYFKIEDWMIEDLHLKGAELLVFAYLYSWGDRDITETQKQIYTKLGISKRNFVNVVQKLHLLMGAKIAPDVVQKLHQKGAKIALWLCKNCTSTIHKQYSNTTVTEEQLTRTRTQNIISDVVRDGEQPTEEPRAEPDEQQIILSGIVDFYAQHLGMTYIPDFRTQTDDTIEIAAKLRMLMAKENMAATADTLRMVWDEWLCRGYEVADNWQKAHWNLKTINNQFNNLYYAIKNGRNTANGGRSSDDAFRASIARYLASDEQ